MKDLKRDRLRLAQRLLDQLLHADQQRRLAWPDRLQHAVGKMAELVRVNRLATRAARMRLLGASRRLDAQARSLLHDMENELYIAARTTDHVEPVAPSLRDVLAEVNQLEAEFELVKTDLPRNILSVHTEPITLEDVYLGPFAIELRVDGLSARPTEEAWRIVAIEPHPAARDDAVSHPHVSHGRLCAGDAMMPLRAALRAGRICDAFLLVRGVLNEYNDHAAYVSLYAWFRQPCADCGFGVDEDSTYSCERCDDVVCDDCIRSCSGCDGYVCRSCVDECPHCERRVWSSCMEHCRQCGRSSCASCLRTCMKTVTQQPA